MTQSDQMVPHMTRQQAAISDIKTERNDQDRRFGPQNHDPYVWLTILMEEVGEVAQAYNDYREKGRSIILYREELVQVAAVALAMIECYDRNNK